MKRLHMLLNLLTVLSSANTVKPRVRLMKQLNSRSGGARLTCLATGFYPRHINMTLLKDGQGIPERLVTVKYPLPNGDGTYQMRTTVEISEEELQQKHNYTCTAMHLSQDNKMDVYWEMLLADDRPGPNITAVAISVLFVCVIAPTAAFLIWKRRRAASQASTQTDYSATSTTEQETCEM